MSYSKNMSRFKAIPVWPVILSPLHSDKFSWEVKFLEMLNSTAGSWVKHTDNLIQAPVYSELLLSILWLFKKILSNIHGFVKAEYINLKVSCIYLNDNHFGSYEGKRIKKSYTKWALKCLLALKHLWLKS